VIHKYRVVELSHDLFPGQEEYLLQVRNLFVEELLPEYKRPSDAHYVMSEIHMWSHVGTHMESPFHYLKEGQDCAEIPITRVVGDAILIDLRHKAVGTPITVGDLQACGSEVRTRDIVFVRTGLSHNYRTPHSHDRPYFTVEAIRWLVERGISCLGVDCSGIEKRGEATQPAHETLFKHGIPLIEHLTNLDQLTQKRFFVVAVPWRVHSLDASPVSVVAFELPGER